MEEEKCEREVKKMISIPVTVPERCDTCEFYFEKEKLEEDSYKEKVFNNQTNRCNILTRYTGNKRHVRIPYCKIPKNKRLHTLRPCRYWKVHPRIIAEYRIRYGKGVKIYSSS